MTTTRRSVTEGCLLGANEVYLTDSVVTDEEQSTLLDWVGTQYRRGKLLENPRNPGAHTTPFRSADGALTGLTNANAGSARSSDHKNLVWVPAVDDHREDAPPEEFWSIRSRVVDLVGLSELEEDHYKGSFLSYIAPGAGIHRHRDARLKIDGEERLILRCNVFLKRPQLGGLPVIESTELDVPDRGMWVFFPTELFHSATPVSGLEFRGLLSFGFLVRFDQLWQRRFRLAPQFERDYEIDSSLDARRALLNQVRSGAADQGVSRLQFDLMGLVLLSTGDFTAQQAAEAIGRPPSEALAALEALQRTNVIESRSSSSFPHGQVMVL
jgi:hypothetical protein